MAGNAFIEYLNSMNNEDGDTTGSLAEFQIKSEYYTSLKVERKIGTFITDEIKNGMHRAYIITGHAGDGKTSILTQILLAINALEPGGELKKEDIFLNGENSLMYLKDLSDFKREIHADQLEKVLKAPLGGMSSILISNTGPLLHAAEELEQRVMGESYSLGRLQKKMLDQLDKNGKDEISIAGYPVFVINIARMDNVFFAREIMKRILASALWEPCKGCEKRDCCPSFLNHTLVNRQFERVIAFVEAYYRYLYENDKRLTIRQITAQITFAMTANLDCDDVKMVSRPEAIFKYNFANLFFGYMGFKQLPNAGQIKGIKEIGLLRLDAKAFDVDYELFVKQNYDCFMQDIGEALEHKLKLLDRSRLYEKDEKANDKSEDKNETFRKIVRRLYLVFGLQESQEAIDCLFDQIFGGVFSLYCDFLEGRENSRKKSKLENLIYSALYVLNTGFLPEGDSKLPLTLKRKDDVFQNVFLVRGQIDRKGMKVITKTKANLFEDHNQRKIPFLIIKGDEEFELSLPLLNYFENVRQGVITPSVSPALTHGLAKLNTILINSAMEVQTDTDEIEILVNETTGRKYERLHFDGDSKIWEDE